MGFELELTVLLFLNIFGTSIFDKFEVETTIWRKILKFSRIYFDIIFFFGGWLLGQCFLQGYEAHVAYSKRAIKLAILSIIFSSIYFFVGRELFYNVLALMAVGITVLHGYWFHYHHGIHWRTAEPREKYLDLIGKNKREG